MRIVKPGFEVLSPLDGMEILRHIEKCGRVCYKSEERITEDSCIAFVRGIVKRGHEAVIEHASVTAKFTVDRGVSHEIVRHRMASYAQESTRYCNYAKDKFGEEITVIEPCFFPRGTAEWNEWEKGCEAAEKSYFSLLEAGATPEKARTVLPNSLKTELVMTANMREWRHFFKLRTDKPAHPQMREVALLLLAYFKEQIPVLFDDIEVER